MDEKTASALARRLAAYSATAGVALAFPAVNAQTAPAGNDPDRVITDLQIVYHDLDPDVDISTRGFHTRHYLMDVDGDDVNDVDIGVIYDAIVRSKIRGYYHRVILSLPPSGNPQNGIVGYRSDWTVASRLDSGAPIGPSQVFYHLENRIVAASYASYSDTGRFPFLGRSGYVGLRFVAGDGALHYGWIRLGVNHDALRARIYEFAYEAEPGTPIAAGDMGASAPAVLLDATVDRTVLPPEGGTLTFTATVTNTTDEPETLNLWAVARKPHGQLVGTRRLGAVTVPAGATVTEEVSAVVPPGAPSGTGGVELHVGHYPRVFDSEAFAITKEAGAPAAEAEGENAFFAAGNALVEMAGTHALSAPRPNPSSGQAELTLEVAEAQGVRVEVLDALGRRVALLHDGPMAAGEAHRLTFDGSGLPVGVYVVRAVGATFADTRVVTLAR